MTLLRDIIREDFEMYYTEEPIYITYVYGVDGTPVLAFFTYWEPEA